MDLSSNRFGSIDSFILVVLAFIIGFVGFSFVPIRNVLSSDSGGNNKAVMSLSTEIDDSIAC